MKRIDLLGKVKQVSPAFADTNILPVMACVWFEQTQITGYNDVIGITTKFDTGFTGAVHGNTLIKLLEHSTYQNDITLVEQDSNLIIKGGKTKMTLASRVVPEDLFQLPKPNPKNKIEVNVTEFAAAIATCQRSVSDSTQDPEHRGITLIPEDDFVHVFSLDGPTMTNVEVDLKGLKERVTLPHVFCRQFAAFATNDIAKWHFEIDPKKGHALVQNEEASLFTKLIEAEKPLDLLKMLNTHAGKIEELVQLPDSAANVLQCAITMIDDINEDKAQVVIANGQLTLSSKGQRGEFTDNFPLEDHPDIKVHINPKHLLTAIDDGLSFIRFGKNVGVMTDQEATSLYLFGSR